MEVIENKSEFQVIVIVEDDDGRLFPLTQDVPKCLLPIGRRPMLAYTLDTIRNSGALEILVVAVNEHHEQLSQFLNSYYSLDDKAKIELVCISAENITGSADYIRAVSNRIRGDFVVVGSDMVTEMNLAHMVRMHRLKASDLVVCVTPFQSEDADTGDKDSKKGSEKVSSFLYHVFVYILNMFCSHHGIRLCDCSTWCTYWLHCDVFMCARSRSQRLMRKIRSTSA